MTDIFFSNFLKELNLLSIRFLSRGECCRGRYRITNVLVFLLGHELFINKLSIVTQLGYYVYYPFDFEGKNVSLRSWTVKRYFGKISGLEPMTLKSHGAKAEAVEFGVGIRL